MRQQKNTTVYVYENVLSGFAWRVCTKPFPSRKQSGAILLGAASEFTCWKIAQGDKLVLACESAKISLAHNLSDPYFYSAELRYESSDLQIGFSFGQPLFIPDFRQLERWEDRQTAMHERCFWKIKMVFDKVRKGA